MKHLMSSGGLKGYWAISVGLVFIVHSQELILEKPELNQLCLC